MTVRKSPAARARVEREATGLSEREIRDVYRRLDLETEEARQRLARLGELEEPAEPEWEVVWDSRSHEA